MAGAPKGNNNHKGKIFSDDMRKVLAQNPAKLRAIVTKLIEEAEGGNLTAIAMIMDRMEGKPVQATEISGPNGNDIQLSIPVHFIKPKDES
jgi:hypothetical protein